MIGISDPCRHSRTLRLTPMRNTIRGDELIVTESPMHKLEARVQWARGTKAMRYSG